MNAIVARACLLLILAAFPAMSPAVVITLNGKTTSQITATVVASNKLLVSDDKGGWFDRLTMLQLRGWDTPYEARARLRVISSSGAFQVRMDQPLVINKVGNAAQVFRQPTVSLGAEGGAPKTLLVGQDTQFHNPPPPTPGEDSLGYYDLAISAYPPGGSFKDAGGTYEGELRLTFEPIARVPGTI